jgi:hypothetical protein
LISGHSSTTRATPPSSGSSIDLDRARSYRGCSSASKGKPSGVWVTHEKLRHAETRLAPQARASYERMVRDWKATSPKKHVGASVTAERA